MNDWLQPRTTMTLGPFVPGDRVVLDHNMTEEVPWPRSAARARRRWLRKGIRPFHRRVPSSKVMMVDGLMIMHPETWEQLARAEVQRRVQQIKAHLEETLLKTFSPDANPVAGGWPTSGDLTAQSVIDMFNRSEAIMPLAKHKRYFRWPTSD